jgi:hypothetical protein
MFESTSPFDDALAKPFLDEPVKKRWSMQTQTDSPSSTKSSASACWTLSGSSSSSSSSRNNDAPVHYLEYQAPDLEEIDFDNQDGNDEELGLLMTPDDLDFAIIRERHQDISEINSSLLQINEIQKGKHRYASQILHIHTCIDPASSPLCLSCRRRRRRRDQIWQS